VPEDGPSAARYAFLRRAMSQDDTFRFAEWGFPKTANAAFRRAAFEAAGGFREDIRTAEDADLSYRLRAAGWAIERREGATVTHRSRQTLRSFVVQRALYGAGGAWLEREYPGSFPARRRPGLMWWAVRTASRGLGAAARSGDRDRALWALFEPLEAVAWELGRTLPNERPLTPGAWWRAARYSRGVRGALRV
jgi:GT2 family glycosyltransferase